MTVNVFMILLIGFVALNDKRTLFLFNGKKYNRGEMLEIIYKYAIGFLPEKDANNDWRTTADIMALRESVKSMGFSLCKEWLGDDKQTIIEKFFEGVYAEWFTYIRVDWDKNTITCYKMNREKFREFLQLFGVLDYDSQNHKKKLRVKHETDKLIKWLEQNAGA